MSVLTLPRGGHSSLRYRGVTEAPSAWTAGQELIAKVERAAFERLPIRIGQPITFLAEAVVAGGGILAGSQLLRDLFGQSTAVPPATTCTLTSRSDVLSAPATRAQSLAQSAIEEIRTISGLTNEQIAPLAGVSRRSLQAWLAGEPVSQRKEERLLALREALRALSTGDSEATRRRLMDQAPGRVRVYDLLAVGQFETAVDLATGRRRAIPPLPERPESEGLVARLSRLEDAVPTVDAPSTGRFFGRLRR